MYRKDRTKIGGGLLLYVNENLPGKIIKSYKFKDTPPPGSVPRNLKPDRTLKVKVLHFNNFVFMTKSLRKAIMLRFRLKNILNKKNFCVKLLR